MKTAIFIRHMLVVMALILSPWAHSEIHELSGPAPDFTLPSEKGDSIKLSDFKGQVVMLNFWASWCAPCREEMPLLEELHQKYKRLGFTVLGVNVDVNSKAAQPLLQEFNISFPIGYDKKSKVSGLYNVGAMPSTFMVDRQGKLRYLHLGYQAGQEKNYDQHIRQLIREP